MAGLKIGFPIVGLLLAVGRFMASSSDSVRYLENFTDLPLLVSFALNFRLSITKKNQCIFSLCVSFLQFNFLRSRKDEQKLNKNSVTFFTSKRFTAEPNSFTNCL